MRATSSSMNEPICQSPAQAQISYRKLRMMPLPWSVCATSGWNCTPKKRRRSTCTAASGQLSDSPITVAPGMASMRSPCDIHTVCSVGRPLNSGLWPCTRSAVRPNSRWSARMTLPPLTWAVVCMP